MNKWYKNLYRRNLVDMHIADWSDEFLSKFDTDKYIENLKIAKIQSPMVYLQSHTGLCNYPTKTGRMHNAFKNNPYKIRDFIEKLKAEGMTPVGYYSLIFNNFAEDKYPQWAMRNYKGETWRKQSGVRYGLCCPNNPDYRNFVYEQIKEISEIFDLDAIFYDMPYWEMFCHCEHCKKKFFDKYGKSIPEKEDWQDKNWLNYIRERQLYMGDFVSFVKKVTNKFMPSTTIEFNYAAVIGCDYLGGSTELVNDGCEFASGDLYGDIYSHSFACKYYSSVTKNQPFEYMTSRCDPNLREHTVLKSEERLTREILLTTAHHGASLIIDAIDPTGTLDKRVYERIGKVFEKQIPYEKYFSGEPLYDVGVFFDSRTQFSSSGYSFNNKWSGVNANKKLVKNHIPGAVISNGNICDMDKCKVIIAPCLEDFDNENITHFIEYINNGGCLILTSKSEKRLMKEFFGGDFVGFTEENFVYMRPTEKGKKYFPDFTDDYPAPIKYKLPVYEFTKNVEVLSKITFPATNPEDNSKFSSIHSNPPMKKSDIPAMIKAKYGKGEVIWISSAIENDERAPFENILINCVKDMLDGRERFIFNGSKNIEVTLFKDNNRYILHFIDFYEDEDLEREFSFTMKTDFVPKRVYYGKSLDKIEYEYKNGIIKFCGRFKVFTTIIIE